MEKLESKIQSSIIKKLEQNGWFVIKIIASNKPGITDLICLRDSRTIFIEVKRPGVLPTPLQKYRHDELRSKGFEVIIATSLSDIGHLS